MSNAKLATLAAVVFVVGMLVIWWALDNRHNECIARGGADTVGYYESVCIDADGRVIP